MAITSGQGNPGWIQDELILALELYFKTDGAIPSATDPRVLALSDEIRGLPIFEASQRTDSFRNAAGVAFKLQNLRQVATGKGLPNTSKADKAVWTDFGDKPDLVIALAKQIRFHINSPQISRGGTTNSDEDEFIEGRILTRIHKARERDRNLRRQLIKSRIAKTYLKCEVCGDGSKSPLSAIADAGFEVHHILPLAFTTTRATRLKDLALLCATCHRLIHRYIALKRRWVSIDEFREVLT